MVVELITPNTEVNYPEKRKRSRVTFPDDLPDEPDLVSETSSQFDNIDKSFELSDKVPDFGGANYPGKGIFFHFSPFREQKVGFVLEAK